MFFDAKLCPTDGRVISFIMDGDLYVTAGHVQEYVRVTHSKDTPGMCITLSLPADPLLNTIVMFHVSLTRSLIPLVLRIISDSLICLQVCSAVYPVMLLSKSSSDIQATTGGPHPLPETPLTATRCCTRR